MFIYLAWDGNNVTVNGATAIHAMEVIPSFDPVTKPEKAITGRSKRQEFPVVPEWTIRLHEEVFPDTSDAIDNALNFAKFEQAEPKYFRADTELWKKIHPDGDSGPVLVQVILTERVTWKFQHNNYPLSFKLREVEPVNLRDL